MRSLRWSFGTGLLCASAVWSACGGVADPGPLPGRDGDAGNTFGLGGLDTDGAGDEAEGQGGRGGALGGAGQGGAGREGNPPLGLAGSGFGGSGFGGGGVGNGGRANATGGSNGTGGNPAAGMGGAGASSGAANGGSAALGGNGAEPETGGSGGNESGSGGAEVGTGGTASGSGGTEPENGGSGGEDTVNGGSGGVAAGGSGTDPENGGSGGQAGDSGETGGSGGEIAQGGGAGSDVPSEPPPIIDVEVGQCEAFEPCGGDVEGVWTYTAACVDLADLGLTEDEIQGMCPGAQLTLSGQVSGTLTFEDGLVTRQGQSVARGEVFVPAACALVLGGCGGVEDELAATGLAGAVCIAQGLFLPTCRCSFVMSAPELDEVAFITDGDVLRLADGRDFQYCASGDNLSYVEIGTVSEPGVRELTRR